MFTAAAKQHQYKHSSYCPLVVSSWPSAQGRSQKVLESYLAKALKWCRFSLQQSQQAFCNSHTLLPSQRRFNWVDIQSQQSGILQTRSLAPYSPLQATLWKLSRFTKTNSGRKFKMSLLTKTVRIMVCLSSPAPLCSIHLEKSRPHCTITGRKSTTFSSSNSITPLL